MNEHYAYLAGIIDGEGTITIHRHQQYNRQSFQLRPRLIVANTNRPLIEELKRRHGGSVISNGVRKEGWKEALLWRVCGTGQILTILNGARPFLIVKARQADIMLAFLNSRRSAQQGINWFRSYTDEDIDAFEQIRAMNTRIAA